MSDTVAIKTFLESGHNGMPTSAKEMLEFKKACTDAEWHQFAVDAAEALGVELKSTKAVAA